MAKNLYSANVDTSTVDNLVSGTLVPCKVIAGTLATGQGELERGTLLYSADGVTYTKYTAADEIHGVLMLTVDTDDADECDGAPIAFGGEFNQSKIEEVTGITLSALAIANARGRQLFIAPMNPAPEAFTV